MHLRPYVQFIAALFVKYSDMRAALVDDLAASAHPAR
jgi:hypothetical protein